MESKTKQKLLVKLARLYPDPRSELNFLGDYQLIVCVILSAQCTDKKVNQLSPLLFSRYPDFCSLSNANVEELESIIRPINYYKTKAKNLISMAKKVIQEFSGRLPSNTKELVSLSGVGQKTANVILAEKGVPAFPVDTHVFRVSRRLGLAASDRVEKVELELKKSFKASNWRNLHHRLIFHGRRICKAQRPRCESCTLLDICPYGKKLMATARKPLA